MGCLSINKVSDPSMRLSPLVPVAALVLAVSACGASGSDDAASTTVAEETTTSADEATTTTEGGPSESDADADAYAEGLAVGLASADEESGELVLSSDEAECVAPEWVDLIGVDTLTGADVVPEDLEDPDFQFTDLGLDPDTGGDMIDAFGDCDVDIISEFYETLSADLDDEQVDCLVDELGDEQARQFLIEALVQTDLSAELNDELERIDSVCELS